MTSFRWASGYDVRDMFERILVPIDGSQCSRAAIQLAMRIAKSNSEAAIILCHVLEPAQPGETPGTAAAAILKQAHAETQSYQHIETFLSEGQAVHEIINAAKDKRADLIVMGSHGERGLPQLFLGSVAEGVLRAAGVPVLVVPVETARPRRTASPGAPSKVA